MTKKQNQTEKQKKMRKEHKTIKAIREEKIIPLIDEQRQVQDEDLEAGGQDSEKNTLREEEKLSASNTRKRQGKRMEER